MRRPWQRMAEAGAASCLVVGGLVLSWALGAGGPRSHPVHPVPLSLPSPSGSAALGTVELHLVDPARRDPWVAEQPRELMVSVWYPAAQASGRPLARYMQPGAAGSFEHGGLAAVDVTPAQVDLAAIPTHARVAAPADVRDGARPVVLFSPGGGIPRTAGTVLVEELTSQGFVVVTIDHTHEASEVEFPDGRVELGVRMAGTTEHLRQILATRVADVRFVLDQLEVLEQGGNPDAGRRRLPSGLGRVLDLTRVGAFGHSAGGFTAAETMMVDRRVDAGANLDGSLGYDLTDRDFGAAAQAGLDRPFLLMGAGTSGPDDQPHTHQHAPDWQSLWQRSTGWKRDLHLPDGEHFSFTDSQALLPQLDRDPGIADDDLAAAIGTVDPVRSLAAQRAYLTAFFAQHLQGQPQPLLDGPSPTHPDVRFIR